MFETAQLTYLLLPAYLANMASPFVKYWPWWNRPISKGRLGTHKTVTGLSLGVERLSTPPLRSRTSSGMVR